MSTSLLPVPVQPGLSPLAAPPGPDAEDSAAGMSVMQVTCILRAFWKHILVTVLVIMVVSALGISLLPKMYVAKATVLINHSTKDPLADGREMAMDQNFVQTEIDLINSAGSLLPVIEKLDLIHDPQFTHGFKGTPAAVRDVVVGNLRDSMIIAGGQNSDLLFISVAYPSSQKAADIANAVAREYIKQERMRVTLPAGESLARYSEDLKDLQRKVDEAQERVTEFRKQHAMIDVEGDNLEAQALTDLEGKLLAAQNERRMLETSQVAPNASPDILLEADGVPALRSKLSNLQEQMARLLQTLGPKHPSVIELQAQINSTQRSLESEVQAISSNHQMSLTRARELEAKYQAAVDAQRARVVERRTLQEQASALVLQLKSAQTTYTRALDGYDANRYRALSESGHVTLVELATPPVKADKPKKVKLFLLACAAALGIGLGWPFAYELLIDRRLRCRDDLERSFGMPVLAQFGPIGMGSA